MAINAVVTGHDAAEALNKIVHPPIEQTSNNEPPSNEKVAEVRSQKVEVGLPPPDNIDQDRSKVPTAKPNYQAMKPKYLPPKKGGINPTTRNKAY